MNYDLLKLETNTHYERRSVSVAEMHYNEDGTIQEVPYWADTKLEQIGTFNPFRKVEAETMAWGYGLKTAPNADKSLSVVDVNNGEYICVRGVNFGKNKARCFEVSALPLEGGNLKIRLDAPDGKIVGNVNIPQEMKHLSMNFILVRSMRSVAYMICTLVLKERIIRIYLNWIIGNSDISLQHK